MNVVKLFAKVSREVNSRVAFKITDDCLSCGVCADECPDGAINEYEDKYCIDPDISARNVVLVQRYALWMR